MSAGHVKPRAVGCVDVHLAGQRRAKQTAFIESQLVVHEDRRQIQLWHDVHGNVGIQDGELLRVGNDRNLELVRTDDGA